METQKSKRSQLVNRKVVMKRLMLQREKSGVSSLKTNISPATLDSMMRKMKVAWMLSESLQTCSVERVSHRSY